jgi:hypothetical protein
MLAILLPKCLCISLLGSFIGANFIVITLIVLLEYNLRQKTFNGLKIMNHYFWKNSVIELITSIWSDSVNE